MDAAGWSVGAVAALAGTALAAYALGSVSGAYYLVRLRTGRDVRGQGSGNAGATNAGRVLGPSGFIGAAAIDVAKAALAVLAARWLGLGLAGEVVAVLAVVAGHVWPPQLGFRGGKGIASALGGALVLAPLVALAAAGVFLVVWGVSRRYHAAGLVALVSAPGLAWGLGRSVGAVVGVGALVALVLVAHAVRRRAPAPDRAPAISEPGDSPGAG